MHLAREFIWTKDAINNKFNGFFQLKLKKLQLENERIWQIENENRRLLSRLADIMNRARTGGKARFSVYSSKCVNSHTSIFILISQINLLKS